MREIKFRAWDKAKKMMETEFTKHIAAEDGTEFSFPAFRFTSNGMTQDIVSLSIALEDPKRYEVMQFTGLKDKNGKEIYRGDIVKVTLPDDWCYEEGDAAAHPDAGRVVNISEVTATDEGMLKFFVFPNDPWYEYEVIGNIYENPELL